MILQSRGPQNRDPIFLCSTPKIGEDEPNLTWAYFSDGWEKTHQPVVQASAPPWKAQRMQVFMLIEEPFTGENVARSVRLGEGSLSSLVMLECWVVKRPGVIRKVWDDWWWSWICLYNVFPFFQTVSENKHEWLAGFLSTCDSCNMWFFAWS